MSPAGAVLLSVHVAGTPRPQGSKRGFVVQGRGSKPRAIVVDDNKASLRDWRSDVIGAVRQAWHALGERPALTGPVGVRLVFALPRPAKPKWWAPAVKGADLDKLERTILDALEIAGVLVDDAQVCDLASVKRYPGPAVALTVPGVLITVSALTPEGLPA